MSTKTQKIWIGVGAVLLVLLVVVTLAIVLVDWRGRTEELASATLGREVRFEYLGIDFGLPSRIEIADIRITNRVGSDGEASGNLLTLDSLHVAVRPWSLLWGPVALPEISAAGLRLNLTRDASGQGNWVLLGQVDDTAAEAISLDTRAELPTLGKAVLHDARTTFNDAPSDVKIQARVDHLEGTASPTDLAFDLEGSVEQRPLKIHFEGGALNTLRYSSKPYPVDLELDYGDTAIALKGGLSEPLELQAVNLQLEAKGPSLSDLYPLLPTAVPVTPRYRMTGSVSLKEKRWEVRNLRSCFKTSQVSERQGIKR